MIISDSAKILKELIQKDYLLLIFKFNNDATNFLYRAVLFYFEILFRVLKLLYRGVNFLIE